MNLYKSKDFYFSCYLLAEGCNLISTPVKKGVTTFIFEENEALINLVNQFYGLKAKVEPTNYANAIKTLKSILHNSKLNANDGNYNHGFNNKSERTIN
jgi:Domain of unknown function (DUF5659)